MKSPFPGMDPFLELPAYWSDFHSRFINAWCEAIAEALPPDYEATLGERVYVGEQDALPSGHAYPDLVVTQRQRSGAASFPSSGTAAMEPVTIPLQILEGPRETYIAGDVSAKR